MRATLILLPTNVHNHPHRLDVEQLRDGVEMALADGLCRYYALDDAWANRLAWI